MSNKKKLTEEEKIEKAKELMAELNDLELSNEQLVKMGGRLKLEGSHLYIGGKPHRPAWMEEVKPTHKQKRKTRERMTDDIQED